MECMFDPSHHQPAQIKHNNIWDNKHFFYEQLLWIMWQLLFQCLTWEGSIGMSRGESTSTVIAAGATAEQLPLQRNDCDCGVLICMYAEHLLGISPMTQETMWSMHCLHQRWLWQVWPLQSLNLEDLVAGSRGVWRGDVAGWMSRLHWR